MRLKKVLACVLALSSISCVGVASVSADDVTYTYPTAPGTYLLGDVTEDGTIRNNDVQSIRMSLLKIDGYDYTGNRLADVTKDGEVRNNDVQLLRQSILHMLEEEDLGSFTIYEGNVIGGSDVLPALDDIDDITNLDKDTVSDVAAAVIDTLADYNSLTDEQKAEIDTEQLVLTVADNCSDLEEALKSADEETAESLAETVTNIVETYKELKLEQGISKEELIDAYLEMASDNGYEVDANQQAYLTSVFAQASIVYDTNGGVITADQLLDILNSLEEV